MLSLETVFEAETELDENLWFANELLEAPSEVARRAQEKLTCELDYLLNEFHRCTHSLQLCEIGSSNLLQCLKNAIFLHLAFLV